MYVKRNLDALENQKNVNAEAFVSQCFTNSPAYFHIGI